MPPVRTCVGCRQQKAQADLLRVIRRPDGTLEIGRTLPGRGAWVCPATTCVDQAERRRAFSRAFKADLADGALAPVRARMEQVATGRA